MSWFTSFQYFDDTDNRRVLQEAHRVLRPDGRLLIENNNLVELLPRWQPAFVTERDGHFQIDRSCFDPRPAGQRPSAYHPRGRTTLRVLRAHVRGRRATGLLLDAGFTSVNLVDPNGDPLTAQTPHDLHRVPVGHRSAIMHTGLSGPNQGSAIHRSMATDDRSVIGHASSEAVIS